MTAAERATWQARIADEACRMIAGEVEAGAVVALYAAKGSEVDTAELDRRLRAAGLRVAYPRVDDAERVLAFHEAALDELVAGRFGLREPAADAPRVAVEEIAAFVVPGLAFDVAGGRIGWGRGHYDATFAAAHPRALRIGLAFECQIIDEVPREPHDESVHTVITEAAVRRTGTATAG